jgi:predicted metal-dependent hydrolase
MKVTEIFPYEIKRYRRAKVLRIAVKPGGRVVVTMPWRAPLYLAREFVQKKREWVLAAREKMLGVEPLARSGSPAEYKQYKAEALRVFTARLQEFNQRYGFAYKRVSIRNQKTRWGSCSKTGTLSFSYRLLLVPPEVRDYVLVHELCHVKEMNHSRRFWELVAMTCPDYKQLRAQLQHFSTVRE